jgi:hypothetical protein
MKECESPNFAESRLVGYGKLIHILGVNNNRVHSRLGVLALHVEFLVFLWSEGGLNEAEHVL